MNGIVALNKAKKYTDESLKGVGAIKGEKGDPGEPGPKGEPGKDGVSPTAEAMAEELKKDINFVASLKGDPGKDAVVDMEQLATTIKSDTNFIVATKGNKGDKGDAGATAYDLWKEAGNIGTEEDMFNSFHGRSGADGKGIVSIKKVSSDYLTDTYEIEYSDGTSFTYNVVNGANGKNGDKGEKGNGIALIQQTVTSTQDNGINNIKCILDNATEVNFSIKNGSKGSTGNGITSIAKESSAGRTDTYKITYTDGTSTTFTVTNATEVNNLSQLTNDTGFITNTATDLVNYHPKSDVYTKGEIQNLFKNIGNGLSSKIVDILPTNPADISLTTIYLLKATDGSNSYEQFMYIDDSFASLGTTTVDLSGIYSKAEVDNIVASLITSVTLSTILANYVKKTALGKAAFSNSYLDLDDLPTIGSGSADIEDSTVSATTTYSSSKIEKNFAKKNDVDGKVDKEEGKGLSSENFTALEKLKLSKIEKEANKYVLPEADTTTLGGVIIDGTSLKKDTNGVLHAISGGSGGGITSYPLLNDLPTINGNPVNQSNTSDSLDLLSKSEYGSPSNKGNVKKADTAVMLEGFNSGFSPMQYYGTDQNNVLGIHNLPVGGTSTPNLEQATFIGVSNGDLLSIALAKEIKNNKFMIGTYKEIIGEKGVESIARKFSKENYYSYCFNPTNIQFYDEEIDAKSGVTIASEHESSFEYDEALKIWKYDIKNINKIEGIKLKSDFPHYSHELSKGNRNSLITVTYKGTGVGVTSGTSPTAWQFIVDGVNANANAYTTVANNSNFVLEFDFKYPVCMKGLYYLQDRVASHGLFNMYGSKDGVEWKFLDTFIWQGTTTDVYREEIDNDCSYRYYKMQGAGQHNTSGNPWHWEMCFDFAPTDFLVMDKDGNFISVLTNNYDPVTRKFNIITDSIAGEELDVQKLVFKQYGFTCGDLIEEVTVDGETFRPIDKIGDGCSLVSYSDKIVATVGIINTDELIVMNNALSMKTVKNINSIKTTHEQEDPQDGSNPTGWIKALFSIDDGLSWYTFDDTSIHKVETICPRYKRYDEFNEDEKIQWDQFKESVINFGFNVKEMPNIDFNSVEDGTKTTSLLFAYVIHKDNTSSVANIQDIVTNIDEASYACTTDPGDIVVRAGENGIEILSNINIAKLYVNTFL